MVELNNSPMLEWDERSDGVYLKSSRESGGHIDVDTLKKELLEKNIMNFDWARINEVARKGRGTFEFVGPKFITYDTRKDDYFEIHGRPAEATLYISSKFHYDNISLTLKDIEFGFTRKGIVYGINWPFISDMFKKKMFDEAVKVASCKPPINGKNAEIDEKVEIDPDARPLRMADGSVDFKNIKTVQQIKAGELIAIKYPPTEGTPGIDIYGRPLPAERGKDRPLPKGKGTVESPDGKKLLAEVGGYLYRQNETIGIGELLTIPTNVDFATGNIKYSGDVIIYGSIKSGFNVDVKGDIQIEGSVEACEIVSRNGSIMIKNGVFGKNKSKISAKNDITITMAQDTVFECDGIFKFEKSLRNCQVKAGSILSSPRSINATNNFTSYEKIELNGLGIKGAKNYLTVFDKELESKKDKIKELDKLAEKIEAALVPMEKRIRGMNQIARKMETELSPKIKEDLKQVLAQYYTTKKKAQYVQEKKQKLVNELENPVEFLGIIILRGDIIPDVYLNMYGVQHEILNPAKDLCYTWSPDSLISQLAPKNMEDEK